VRTTTTDHVALVTGDTAVTVDFYERVMGCPLVGAHTGTEPEGRPGPRDEHRVGDLDGDAEVFLLDPASMKGPDAARKMVEEWLERR
jgi:catechol 2,3-dioxygenase-like lactoylglutathione lyase family enzyme